MKTAPFDLELAKLGHPLVTSRGQKVLEFHNFDIYISWPVRAVIYSLHGLYSFDNSGKSFMSRTGELLLDLETPWEKPLQQGEEILCYNPSTHLWVPLTFMCMEGTAVVAKGINSTFYMSFDVWKRPEPVLQTHKLDITLDVKINGKDISKEDKTKFMDYLKKFVNDAF